MMVKTILAALAATLPLAQVVVADVNTTSVRYDPVSIKPDKLSYTATGVTANVFGADCNATEVSGQGSFSNYTIKYSCLETGYYSNYNFAITCGAYDKKSGPENLVCQAFREGGSITNADGLVSDLLNCTDIEAKACSSSSKYCPFNCSAPETVCSSFPGGIKYFDKKFGTPTPTTSKITIAPKHLNVNGTATAFKWRQLTMRELCFEANAITTCFQVARITTYKEFNQCLDFRMQKHIQQGLIGKLDADQIKSAADSAGLFKPEKKKKKKKKKKGGKKKKGKKLLRE